MKKIEIIALIDDDDTYIYITKRMLKLIDNINKIGKAAGKLSDLQWILDRFTH